jgi:hypothetical protein
MISKILLVGALLLAFSIPMLGAISTEQGQAGGAEITATRQPQGPRGY